MKTKELRRMLPLFEEDGGGAGADGGNGADPTPEAETPMSFDEMLASNPDYQREFDRRQTKGINTAVTKERDRLNALHNAKLNEAERLAKMNEDEKRAYMDEKREKELADREAAITRRELMAEAKNTLIEKGLPVTFASVLNFTDADSVKAGIEALEKEWTPAIESTVEEKLKGGRPPKDAKTEATHKDANTELERVRMLMKK